MVLDRITLTIEIPPCIAFICNMYGLSSQNRAEAKKIKKNKKKRETDRYLQTAYVSEGTPENEASGHCTVQEIRYHQNITRQVI